MANDEIKGRAKGGVRRAEILTPEERREIAMKGAAARWGDKPLQATHKGNFKEDFGIEVECYVLNDAQKTAVISQRGMGEALGLGKVGSRLPRFVGGKAISEFVGPELREKLEQPVIFQSKVGGPENLTQVHGYDVTILIDLCKSITQAEFEKKLLPHQANVMWSICIFLDYLTVGRHAHRSARTFGRRTAHRYPRAASRCAPGYPA